MGTRKTYSKVSVSLSRGKKKVIEQFEDMGKGNETECSSEGWMDSGASLEDWGRIQEGKQSDCWSISKKTTGKEFRV